jgi:hypothetical protein
MAARKPKPAPPLLAKPVVPPPDDRLVATVDLIVERPDLGIPPESGGTFVRAGDPIPAGQEGFRHRPANPEQVAP